MGARCWSISPDTASPESFPQLWLFGLGALFIAVVLAFPNGLSGIWQDYVQARIDRLLSSRKSKPGSSSYPVADSFGGVRRSPCSSVISQKSSCSRSKRSPFPSTASRPSTILSFPIEENEIRVIIGPNGAGKTTVLDLICGKTRAHSRLDQFRGQELTKLKENQIVRAKRRPQIPDAVEVRDLTVFENLEISFPRGRTVFGSLTFSATRR